MTKVKLNELQASVLRYAMEGYTSPIIARFTGLNHKAVRWHLSKVYGLLDIPSKGFHKLTYIVLHYTLLPDGYIVKNEDLFKGETRE